MLRERGVKVIWYESTLNYIYTHNFHFCYFLQGGTSGDDIAKGIAAGLDGSVVVSGYTDGSSSGNSAGGMDFAAVKLSADGVISWRWQARYSTSLFLLLFRRAQ